MTTPRRFLFALLFSGAAAPLSLAAAEAVDKVEQVGKVAVEWVQTRSETVRLETEWAEQRELRQAAISALEERARLAEETLAQLKAKHAQDISEMDALEKRNEAAEKNHGAAGVRLEQTVRLLQGLRSSLPPRLLAALELPYQSLQDPALPAGERFQHTMTILGRCLQFNRVVTLGEEAITLPGESAPKTLEVAYWGLSHGYALDRRSGVAWLGSPGPKGWQWEARPEAPADVARLIAMANDRADPAFVAAPAKLAHPAR